MMDSNDQLIDKIMELLEGENLFSTEELSLMEEYLCDEADDEVLEKLSFRDLSNMQKTGEVRAQYIALIRTGKIKIAGRLGKLLFTLGQVTSYKMFPEWDYVNKVEGALPLDVAQKLAIRASVIGRSGYRMNRRWLEELIEIGEHNAENFRRAVGYETCGWQNGRLLLLTVYFMIKYPDIKQEGEGRLFGQVTAGSSSGISLEGEDAALMKQYEDICIAGIPEMYSGKLAPQTLNKLVDAVSQDGMNDGIMKLAHTIYKDRFMVYLLSGTAFINYMLSARLQNIVSLCLAADADSALGTMEWVDVREEMKNRGGCFDQIFGVDSTKLIDWASKNNQKILREQFCRNREVYLKYLDSCDFDTSNVMFGLIKEMDPELYQQRAAGHNLKLQAQLIDLLVSRLDGNAAADLRKYLNGEGGIEVVYSYENTLKNSYYAGNTARSYLCDYQKACGSDQVANRCVMLMLMGENLHLWDLTDQNKLCSKNVQGMFSAANAEGMDLVRQLNCYAYIYDSSYSDSWKSAFEDTAKVIFKGYLQERREEMLTAFQKGGSVGRCFGLTILAEEADKNKEIILSFAQDTAKSVREKLLEILYQRKDWEEDIISLLSSKKAADREVAIRVIEHWQTAEKPAEEDASQEKKASKYGPLLTQALEKEKNAKVRTLLETVLGISTDGKGSTPLAQGDLVKELHKGNRKRSLAWAYETPFSKVHKKSGEEADEEYLQAIFLCYSTMETCGVSPSAATLVQELDAQEFAVYVNELFDKWMEAGAEAKKRWVLYAAAIHGGAEIVKKLQHNIQEWPQAARGAIASEAVQALALSPQPQALLIVDGISRKFKFKQVKAGAVKALEFAASQLGITTEELADRIVPNLGFDENMQRIFDYGERKFTVTITTALEIEIFDENGKKLKNLPAPGKKDDETKAAAAYEEFKQMKKQMKTTVTSQKMRLEMALSTERRWSVQAWKNLFVKNPIMHQFAIGLIWGIYEGRELVSSFRYMEDGSFNTEDEEEFTLPGAEDGTQQEETDGEDQLTNQDQGGQGQVIGRDRFIGLVHPIELSEDSLNAWKEQLQDYEIVQPIEQLERPVYYRTEEEEKEKTLERFGGVIINDLSLGGKLTGMGWYRGSVEDGGGFSTYYREDKELSLGVVLQFSGTWVGGENDDVTVYDARFYKAGELVTWSYDKEMDVKACSLKDIPERYFSEIVLQLTRATAAGKARDENWKKQR